MGETETETETETERQRDRDRERRKRSFDVLLCSRQENTKSSYHQLGIYSRGVLVLVLLFFSFSFLFFSDVISQENVQVEDEVVTLGDVTKELNAEGGSDMLQEGMKEFDKMPYAQQQFFADNYRAMADSFK